MIASYLSGMGLWTWWIIGFVLIAIEIVAPGTFFLWFGLAAFIVGALHFVFGLDSAIFGWQAQAILFAILAIALAFIGRKIAARQSAEQTDQPFLNERGANLVGTTAVLSEPISEGYGRAKVGDSTWRVQGADLAKGKRVKVIKVQSGTLIVEAA
ncbi:MAG: NfeD family protein [Nitratireductor sp.]